MTPRLAGMGSGGAGRQDSALKLLETLDRSIDPASLIVLFLALRSRSSCTRPRQIGSRQQQIIITRCMEAGSSSPSTLEQRGEQLHQAIDEGDEDAVRVLLREDAAELASSTDDDDRTPLMHAAELKQPGIMRLLLEAHDPALQIMHMSICGWMPLHYAARYGAPECLRILLEAHDPNEQASTANFCGETALVRAAQNSHHPDQAECMHMLLDLDPSQEQLDRAFRAVAGIYADEQPPHLARVIERLLTMGANIPTDLDEAEEENSGDEHGNTQGIEGRQERFIQALGPIITHQFRPSLVMEERLQLDEARRQLNEAVVETLAHRS